MRIIWIRSINKTEQPTNYNNDEASFRKHDECMKQFSLSHPRIELPKLNDGVTSKETFLVPIQGVKLAEYSQN